MHAPAPRRQVPRGREAQAVATGSFKSADIHKMHTYRDAIGGARIADAVYPGTEQQLYPRDDAMFRSEGGVGAIPLAPRAGVARDSFTSVLDRLITAATDGQSAASRRERDAAAVPQAVISPGSSAGTSRPSD